MPEDAPRRDSTVLFLVMVFPIILVSVWALFRYGLRPENSDVELSPDKQAALNLPEAPPDRPALPLSQTEPAPMARPTAAPGALTPPPESTQAAGSSDREKAFLGRYGKMLAGYQAGLDAIGQKYYKQYPIVRKVDEDFAGLGRYMAARQEYERDGDPYKFIRQSLALPEVRAAVQKYALNPEVWKVAVRMSLEALKNPPPKPIYDEVKRFISTDLTMSDFLNREAKQVAPHIGEILVQEARNGTNIKPLQDLAGELQSAAQEGASAAEAAARREGRSSR